MYNEKNIPKTADGYVIYPGLKVYVGRPFSTEKFSCVTVYGVCGGESSDHNDYTCTLVENRYFDGEYWDDGCSDHVSTLFVDLENCLKYVKEAEAKYNALKKAT